MGTVSTHLVDEARSIFTDLGYAVSRHEGELLAERKWRQVRVTPIRRPQEAPRSGSLRCFVAPTGRADRLRRELSSRDLRYEWALIGVDGDGEYEVYHAPTA